MKIEQAVREFKYSGMVLQDPDPAQTPEEVKTFYAGIYPELTNAEIEGPEHKGNKTVYEFRKAVGTKGVKKIKAPVSPAAKRRLSKVDPAKIARMLVKEMKETLKSRRSEGVLLIASERMRQIEEEHWTSAHDDEHTDGSLAAAAACYAQPIRRMKTIQETRDESGGRGECPVWREISVRVPTGWPESWSAEYWKPKDLISDLVRAGALIAAEIDRLLRAKTK